ncbi:MlaD family protein, partial [Kamptonema cortianum]|nr:MlaD family protein [Kamptonema cortianum]
MERKNIEFYVGLFVIAGLGVCAWLIIEFGKVGQSFQKTWPLQVRFDSGNGLLKGAQVRYTGTLVGRVGDTPRLMTDAHGNQFVLAELRIHEGIQILKGSRFTVGQSGFLGDNYVDIIPPRLTEGARVEFLTAGETLDGSRPADLSTLTAEGADVMEQIKK